MNHDDCRVICSFPGILGVVCGVICGGLWFSGSGVFKGGPLGDGPPFEPTLIFLNSFLTVHLHNYKLEVCRQSLGPFYVNDFADVTPPHASRRLCSRPGTLHSSLGVYD